MFRKQDLKKLIVPRIIEQFLAVMVGMADIMMVSSTEAEESCSGRQEHTLPV